MAFVEMVLRWRDAHGVQRAHPTDAEQRVLRESDIRRAFIEPGGHPSFQCIVLGELGVEQVQRRTSDVHAPHVRAQLTVPHGHLDLERRAVLVAHADRR